MSAFDAAGFLVSLVSMSISVSLLLGGLALGRERLLTRYRARTLYQLGLLLTALLLCPWRPALLLPKISLPALPVQGAVIQPKDASLPSSFTGQATQEADGPALLDMAAGAALDRSAAAEVSGDREPQAQTPQALAPSLYREANIPWALLAVWMAGALMVLLFQTVRHTRFLRLVRRWQSPLPQEIRAALAEQGTRLGITPPPAYTAPCVQSPTLVGLLRPMLLLPPIRYDFRQLGLILAHELVHYKHRHLWGKALGCLALAVHWFNPLMPFAMRAVGALCEMACDEAVLTREAPEARSAYVDAVLNAALLTRTAPSPLCSPLNGGVKQMNQIKQRITLMTPFRPRRMGAGLIACTLLLALLTGSVLAGEASAAVFSISERDWLTRASDSMPHEEYDALMSMQTPGWEDLSTEEYARQITPQLSRLKLIFDRHFLENRFMRHLWYSVAEASYLVYAKYQMPWNTHFWREDQNGGVMLDCRLHWEYLENAKLTCGERNRLLDEALFRTECAVRALNIRKIYEAPSAKDANAAFGTQLNEMAKELGGGALSIWFTGVSIDAMPAEETEITEEQRELLSLLTPEGYRDQTVAEYQVLLEKYQDRFDATALEPMGSAAYRTVGEAYGELKGNPASECSAMVDLSLMPAWTMRGNIWYEYRLEWKTVNPDHMTVGQRHDAIAGVHTRIADEATNATWEAADWEAFDKALKERLPAIAREEGSSALTFTLSEIELKLEPLATEEYVYSAPQNVLKAFMTAWYDLDPKQMAVVCAPIEAEDGQAGLSNSRQEVLKSLAETKPYYWEIGEPRQESGKDDVVTVDVILYPGPPKGAVAATLVKESRHALLRQIDGKWYLLPESMQP